MLAELDATFAVVFATRRWSEATFGAERRNRRLRDRYIRDDYRKSVAGGRSKLDRSSRENRCSRRPRDDTGEFGANLSIVVVQPLTGGRSFVIFDAKLADYHFPLVAGWQLPRHYCALTRRVSPSVRVKRRVSDQRAAAAAQTRKRSGYCARQRAKPLQVARATRYPVTPSRGTVIMDALAAN